MDCEVGNCGDDIKDSDKVLHHNDDNKVMFMEHLKAAINHVMIFFKIYNWQFEYCKAVSGIFLGFREKNLICLQLRLSQFLDSV